MSYRISTVSEMTGIPRNTLIAWERRYGLLNPERLENGYRRYTGADVDLLFRLKNALNAGLKISEAVKLVQRANSQANDSSSASHETSAMRHGSDGLAELRRDIFDALASYRIDSAQRLLASLITVPFRQRLSDVYFPLLRQLGDAWEQGVISVAQEHFASGIIKGHLATLFISTSQSSVSAPHSACTTLPHDEHDIAALALSIELSMAGHRVSYLGAKLPLSDLIGFCKSQKPHLLCISCITLPSDEEFEAYLKALAACREKGTRIVLGGTVLSGRKFDGPIELIPSWEAFSEHL
jgi:DNA-binding transcriptional MerR regulator/methylmalonyl-CoA mutase cobalamin-binding subunit